MNMENMTWADLQAHEEKTRAKWIKAITREGPVTEAAKKAGIERSLLYRTARRVGVDINASRVEQDRINALRGQQVIDYRTYRKAQYPIAEALRLAEKVKP